MGKMAVDRAHNVVTTDTSGVITAVLRGKQTGESIRALGVELQKHMDALRVQGKKVRTLSDIRNLKASDSTREARLESKNLLSLRADASAVLGNQGVLSLTMYLVRIAKSGSKIRFFSNERKARAWLKGVLLPKRQRTAISLAAGIAIGLIGAFALIGWQIDNPYLTRGIVSLQPMDPAAAVGLLAISYGFICYWYGSLRQLKAAGVFGILIGIVALLPLHEHRLLFSHKIAMLEATGGHMQFADSAALCFIAVGLSPFTVGTKRTVVRLLQYLLGATIIGLSIMNIFGQLYAPELLQGVSGRFVMAFNLAVAFLIVGAALVLLVVYRQIGDVLGGITRTGWLVMTALIFVQVATYGAWSQSIVRNTTDSSAAFLSRGENLDAELDRRVKGYTDALYGFRGLFVASESVDQGEFQAYYNSLNLTTTYPGLRALSFIAKVQEKDLPAFVAQRKADKSLYPAGNPAFAITAKSTLPIHYISTYSATSVIVGGTDLGSTPSRLAAFQRAESQSRPISSGTVQFAAANGVPAQSGFFITTPVANKAKTSTTGFVNTVFNYNDFFAHAFTPESLLNGLTISIYDTMDGTTVYRSARSAPHTSEAFSRIIPVPVADRTWNMSISAPGTFGISASQTNLPRTILAGGQLFSVLLLLIFVLQMRARRQGFELADSITEDLEFERNRAVANDLKSTAILSSIGDAVFAVDTKLHITLFNPAAERISGFDRTEVLGKRYDEVLRFELEKSGHVNNRFVHEALTGHVSSMANHTVLVNKDGSRVPVADSAAPIYDANQSIRGAIIVFRDVSKDYELDKAKTEFVSLASHQLRTPLSAINWYGEMLLNGDAGKLNKDQHEYIKEIFQGNSRMIELVNSLLDASRIEVGKLANEPVPTAMAELIDSLQKELTNEAPGKQPKIVKDIKDIPAVVADPKQLRMIVQNLLSNAVKYTPEKGTVTVTLRKATAADMDAAQLESTRSCCFLSVQDTGYGIPKDEQSKIFGKLFRADNVRKLDVEGTGLGLYIVKEVVEKLGGRVWFTSVESVGTTFSLVLPFREEHTK